MRQLAAGHATRASVEPVADGPERGDLEDHESRCWACRWVRWRATGRHVGTRQTLASAVLKYCGNESDGHNPNRHNVGGAAAGYQVTVLSSSTGRRDGRGYGETHRILSSRTHPTRDRRTANQTPGNDHGPGGSVPARRLQISGLSRRRGTSLRRPGRLADKRHPDRSDPPHPRRRTASAARIRPRRVGSPRVGSDLQVGQGLAGEDRHQHRPGHRQVDPRAGSVTLADYLRKHWLPARALRGLKPTTLDNYRWICESYIIPRIGHLQLRTIEPREVVTFFDEFSNEVGRAGKRRRLVPSRSPIGSSPWLSPTRCAPE